MSKFNGVQARRKQRLAQISPIGKETEDPDHSSSDDFELDEEDLADDGGAKKELSLLEKITSTDPETRTWAIGSLSRLVLEDQEALKRATKPEILLKIVKSLFDSDQEVCISAAGLLRNLTSLGNPDVCNQVIGADCLTCLVCIFKNHFIVMEKIVAEPEQNRAPLETKMEGEDIEEAMEGDEDYEPPVSECEDKATRQNRLLANSLILLTNLCEFSNLALERFTAEGILAFVFQLLKPNITTHEIQLCAADLLNIVTEDYEPVLKQITADQTMFLKMFVANQKNDLHLRTVLSSVLCNLCPLTDQSLLTIMLTAISNCLDFDNTLLFQQIIATPDGLVGNETPFAEWSSSVRAQIVALETLTNILTSDDDSDTLPPLVIKMAVESSICNKVLPLCKFLDTTITKLKKLEYLNDLFTSLTVVQFTALSCLNNIILGLPTDVLGNTQSLYDGLFVWCGQAFSSENVVSDDTKTLVLSCLRAVVQKSRTLKPESWQVEAAFKLATHPLEQVRVHSVGMLGFFAKMPHVGPSISNELGALIVSLLSDTSGWVIAEAFDVIFLVFDDLYDDVIVKVNLLQKMKEFETFLKTKMKDPAIKADQLLFTKLDEVLANIDPFLDYKRQQQRAKKR